MWTEIFELPFYIMLLIVFLVNARIGNLKSEVKELKQELEQTKEWLRDEIIRNEKELYKEKIEKGE